MESFKPFERSVAPKVGPMADAPAQAAIGDANVRFRPKADICTTKPMRERNPNPIFRRNVIIAFAAILVSRWLSRRVDEPWLLYVVAGLALIVMVKEVFKALSEWK